MEPIKEIMLKDKFTAFKRKRMNLRLENIYEGGFKIGNYRERLCGILKNFK